MRAIFQQLGLQSVHNTRPRCVHTRGRAISRLPGHEQQEDDGVNLTEQQPTRLIPRSQPLQKPRALTDALKCTRATDYMSQSA